MISSTATIALGLRTCVNSVPPKEPPPGCLREDASPKASTHRNLKSLTRFTLIYPSCSVSLFGNECANVSTQQSVNLLRQNLRNTHES